MRKGIPDGKNRLTLFMRQSLHHYFDPDVELPEGRVRTAVLLVHGARHARLEDMSFAEPSYWLRTHRFEVDGHTVERKAGDKVGALGIRWRETRRKVPYLFYSSRDGEEKDWQPRHVLVWFQIKATEDGVIAAWLSDLIVQEGDKFSLSTTDCVASEHSPEMRLKKWLNNSVQHTIGMRQTAKTQVTDIRYAKIGKDGAKPMMTMRRRLHRKRARQHGKAPTLTSTHLDLMHIALAMQRECIKDNKKNKGVLKAFRMGGWTAYRPTPSGLKPALDSAHRDCPLGSSRLSPELIAQRFDWVDQAGLPIRPDWSELTAVRRRKTVGFGRKKKAVGSERRKNMEDAKADLAKLAARVSSEVALLRDRLTSD